MSTEREGLEALLARVRAATKADGELGWAIQAWVAEHVWRWPAKRIGPDADGDHASDVLVPPHLHPDFCYPPLGAVHRWFHVPRAPVTATVDAAVNLIRRAIPGTAWIAGDDLSGAFCLLKWPATDLQADYGETEIREARDRGPPTVPLAMMCALLMALRARTIATAGQEGRPVAQTLSGPGLFDREVRHVRA